MNEVLAWRSDVGNHEGLCRLEDMMARHVEREKEALREMGAAHKSEEGVVNLYDAMEIACCDTVFDGLDLQAD